MNVPGVTLRGRPRRRRPKKTEVIAACQPSKQIYNGCKLGTESLTEGINMTGVILTELPRGLAARPKKVDGHLADKQIYNAALPTMASHECH